MTKLTRGLVLSLIVLAASTVAGLVINSFLTVLEMVHQLPRATIYAPLSSIIRNIFISSAVSDPKIHERLLAFKIFFVIQSAIFVILVLIASIFILTRSKPSSAPSALICSLFIVIGLVIMQISIVPFMQSYAPNVKLTPFSLLETILNVALNALFYAVLFFIGTVILTDAEPAKTQRQAPYFE